MTRSRPTPLRSKLARCLQYKQPWRRPCRRRRHINISEVRAVALAMDSLGALGKGRSSSAHVLRSAEKPADNGTRDVPCASPLRSCQAEPRRPADREQRHAGADFCEPGASGFFCWQYTVAAGRELDLSKRGFLDLYSGSFGAARALAALSSTGTVPRTFSAKRCRRNCLAAPSTEWGLDLSVPSAGPSDRRRAGDGGEGQGGQLPRQLCSGPRSSCGPCWGRVLGREPGWLFALVSPELVWDPEGRGLLRD